MVTKKCVICGVEFQAKRTTAKYCSQKCRRKADNDTERARLARKTYAEKNKEKKRLKDKNTRDNYSDERKREIKERRHQYYLQNKEKILDDNKKWKIENSAYYSKYCHNYAQNYNKSEHGKYINRMKVHKRRCMIDNIEEIDYVALKIKFDNLGNRCVVCGTTENITIDHITPITKGGTNDIDNLQPLCKSCNSSKGNKTMEEFKEYLKYKKALERVV